jgi:hypothetical protein
MKTPEEIKEFALSQLAPYLKDPSTCGYDKDSTNCEYLSDNKMCVAGKNMVEPKFGLYKGIDDILEENDNEQHGIFKPEVVGILTNKEWKHMQTIHDAIAVQPDKVDNIKERVGRLNLFTYEELLERAESLE